MTQLALYMYARHINHIFVRIDGRKNGDDELEIEFTEIHLFDKIHNQM